jgi:hypothetical protein
MEKVYESIAVIEKDSEVNIEEQRIVLQVVSSCN